MFSKIIVIFFKKPINIKRRKYIMKIVSNTVWDGLKLPDYRARFFIEVWKEILYVNTPSFYQSKMINTMSGAEELVEAIDDYIQDDKSKKSLLSMIEDYKGNLKKDSIAKDTFKNLHATLLKKIETVPDPISSNYILELKTISKQCQHPLNNFMLQNGHFQMHIKCFKDI